MTDMCILWEKKHLHSKNELNIKICRGCFDESVPQYPDESVPQLGLSAWAFTVLPPWLSAASNMAVVPALAPER